MVLQAGIRFPTYDVVPNDFKLQGAQALVDYIHMKFLLLAEGFSLVNTHCRVTTGRGCVTENLALGITAIPTLGDYLVNF